MKSLIRQRLEAVVKELYGFVPEAYNLEVPREKVHGDYATNIAFLLAKNLKRKPDDIAQEIANKLSDAHLQAQALRGFINFKFKEELLKEEFVKLLENPQLYFFEKVKEPLYMMVEFVSANPTGPLHVGHGRGAVVGDVLARILEKFGHKVVREYYINDAGYQVYLLGLSVLYRYYELYGKEDLQLKEVFEREGYRGEYIKELAKEAKELYGSNLLEKDKEEAIDFLREFATKKLLEEIKATLEEFDVFFDSWVSERKLHQEGLVEEVLKELERRGYIYEQEGALWFKSSAFGDDKDRVVRRSDGTYTYFAGDIAYHYHKYRRGFQKVINLWGSDHHGYEKRLIASLQALGIPKDWLVVEFVQMVKIFKEGQEVRMSKRTGDFVSLQELLQEVGKDAVRFVFLTKTSDTPLDFDIDLVKKKSSENPVFYVQYAHARIRGVFREVKERYGIDADSSDLRPYIRELDSQEDIELIKKCLFLKDVYEGVLDSFSPHLITYSLIELAKDFHHYYNHHRVMVEDKKVMLSRLTLFKGVELTLKTAFEILGISAPERM